MMKNTRIIIAHRGGSGEYVENTLAAFINAIDKNCDMAELDVHLTKDGYIVVHHNNKLNINYTKNMDEKWIDKKDEHLISDLTLSELRQFSIGEVNPNTNYKHKFPNIKQVSNQKIPTLKEVIELVKQRSDTFKLVIEIKTNIFESSKKPWKSLVDKVLLLLSEESFTDRAVLCSFDWNSLVYAKTQEKSITTWFTTLPFSWLTGNNIPKLDIPPTKEYQSKLIQAYKLDKADWHGVSGVVSINDFADIIYRLGGDALFCYYSDIYSDTAKNAATLNLDVMAWSVNLTDKKELLKIKNSNIDGFCSDYL